MRYVSHAMCCRGWLTPDPSFKKKKKKAFQYHFLRKCGLLHFHYIYSTEALARNQYTLVI